MRILYTYYTFPPAVNGIARFLGDVTEVLAKKGHKIEVVTGGVEKKSIRKKGNLRVHRLPFYNLLSKVSSETKSKKFLKYLITIHKKRPIDIIEAQGMVNPWDIPYSIAMTIFSIMYDVPLVLRFHSMGLSEQQKPLMQNLFW